MAHVDMPNAPILSLPLDRTDATLICVQAPNRAALLHELRPVIDTAPSDEHADVVALRCTLPCGTVMDFNTLADIPAVSVPCPCGHPRHWIIRYDEDHG